MAEESPSAGRRSLVKMLGIGLVVSALGVGLGLLIDWFPVQASTQAPTIDTLYDVLLAVSVPIFVMVTVVILYCVWRFRARPGQEQDDGAPIHGNTRLEVVWTALPAVLLVALCTYAFVALDDIEDAQAGERRIGVTAQQFAWSFEYPNPRGGEPIRSKDLVLVEGEPVLLNLRALDVIHSFWVPAFRMKRDAVPGLTTQLRVTPTRRGRYPVVCAELCGAGHAYMRASVTVVNRQQFDAWMAQQTQEPQEMGG